MSWRSGVIGNWLRRVEQKGWGYFELPQHWKGLSPLNNLFCCCQLTSRCLINGTWVKGSLSSSTFISHPVINSSCPYFLPIGAVFHFFPLKLHSHLFATDSVPHLWTLLAQHNLKREWRQCKKIRSGVSASFVEIWTFALCWRSDLTIISTPSLQATCRGVSPRLF